MVIGGGLHRDHVSCDLAFDLVCSRGSRMIRWLSKWWNAYRRRIDIKILWPICKQYAATIADAREAFYIHTCLDPAWRDITPDECVSIIEGLS